MLKVSGRGRVAEVEADRKSEVKGTGARRCSKSFEESIVIFTRRFVPLTSRSSVGAPGDGVPNIQQSYKDLLKAAVCTKTAKQRALCISVNNGETDILTAADHCYLKINLITCLLAQVFIFFSYLEARCGCVQFVISP